jgi:hypothetical protein
MCSSTSSRAQRYLIVGSLTLGAITTITLPTPALAVDGRTRVGQCIDATASGQRCGWSVNDKGEVDVCDKTGCVTCPSATSECTPARIVHDRPRPGLPPGTVINTPVGAFQIGQRR